jgi:hypothetical protein
MHNFIVNKTVLEQKTPAPNILEKEGDEFVFSDNEWVLEDNGQQFASIKRNKKDDHDKNPDGMGSARSSSVSEISVSSFTISVNSKASQKDKQPNNNNKNSTKKKGNIVSCNIMSILRLVICY